MLLVSLIIQKRKNSKPQIACLITIFQVYFSALTFFDNAFSFDGTVLPMIVFLIIAVFPKIKFVKQDVVNNIKK